MTSPGDTPRNAAHRFSNTAILDVSRVEAPRVVTSAEFDEQLAGVYDATGLRSGMLADLAGIKERRWWSEGATYIEGAAHAGAKAISESGVDPAQIGVMINTSVSRLHLEPSSAVAVHDGIGLPRSCRNFDLANACLGFVNGIEVAAAMIDSGVIEYALVVNGEDSQPVQTSTLRNLLVDGVTADDVMSQFATLTLGSGAAAMVLGRADEHPEGHRVVGSVNRAGTEHHDLCVGSNDGMRTNLRGLLEAGLQLSEDMWTDARTDFDWADMDRYVIHQVSQVHTGGLCDRLGIDQSKVPLTFPEWGNIGPASVPFTLAGEKDSLHPGDRVLLMGIGSGLNASCMEIAW